MNVHDAGDEARGPLPRTPAVLRGLPHAGGGVESGISVPQLARLVDHRLHVESLDPDSLARSVRLAVEYGVGAVTCRPGDVATVATLVREHATDVGLRWRRPGSPGQSAPAGTAGAAPPWRSPLVGVATALEFERRATSVEALLEETRDLTLSGASELALLVDEQRLPVPPARDRVLAAAPAPTPDRGARRDWREAVAALVEAQPRYRFRLRVHLDTSEMTDDVVRRACESLRAAGVWMVQAGTWRGPRTSFSQIRVMREALGGATRLKWTSPVSSLHGLLLAVAEGVDRCNAEDTFVLLGAAEQHARVGPIRVPRPGLVG
ncbi:hypothetical protein [Intrasporangium flavum]|uniref:hypothetical protein n=1 Tax=Intrasporangium flavum TaxID=1428657 RepID=UPI00096C3467|nr:hypothetical protein [Intrasporangium flavum]